MVTSVDLMKTVAACPTLSPRSVAASLVTDEVTIWSPPSSFTFTTAITVPRSTSVMVPLSWFRVDSRIAVLHVCGSAASLAPRRLGRNSLQPNRLRRRQRLMSRSEQSYGRVHGRFDDSADRFPVLDRKRGQLPQ